MNNAKWLLVLPAAVFACGILLAACGGGGSNAYAPHRHGNENWEHKATLADMQYEDDPHSSLFRCYVLTRTLKRSDIRQTPAHHPFIGSLAGVYVFVDCSHTLTAAFKAGSHTSN
jgi:hypothetical protein